MCMSKQMCHFAPWSSFKLRSEQSRSSCSIWADSRNHQTWARTVWICVVHTVYQSWLMFDTDRSSGKLTDTLNLVCEGVITWWEATTVFQNTSRPQRGLCMKWGYTPILRDDRWCSSSSDVAVWSCMSVPKPDCSSLALFPAMNFNVMLHLSVYLQITSNFTDAAEVPLMKTNKQFLAQPKKKGDHSKEMLEKLTSAAAVSKCHMLLFLQLCKLWDV